LSDVIDFLDVSTETLTTVPNTLVAPTKGLYASNYGSDMNLFGGEELNETSIKIHFFNTDTYSLLQLPNDMFFSSATFENAVLRTKDFDYLCVGYSKSSGNYTPTGSILKYQRSIGVSNVWSTLQGQIDPPDSLKATTFYNNNDAYINIQATQLTPNIISFDPINIIKKMPFSTEFVYTLNANLTVQTAGSAISY
jgi:hypothetical protein